MKELEKKDKKYKIYTFIGCDDIFVGIEDGGFVLDDPEDIGNFFRNHHGEYTFAETRKNSLEE